MACIESHGKCRDKFNKADQAYTERVFGNIIHLPADKGRLHGDDQDKKETGEYIGAEFRVL
jgi:hypothetical protein